VDIIDEIARIIAPAIWDDLTTWSGHPQESVDRINSKLKYKRAQARTTAGYVLKHLAKEQNWRKRAVEADLADWRKIGFPAHLPEFAKRVREFWGTEP